MEGGLVSDPVTPEQLPSERIVNLAVNVSRRSPCRSKRGVVVFDPADGFVLAAECNRKPEGFSCDGSVACKANCRREAVHAEQAALLRVKANPRGADLLHVKSVDGVLVPSGGPSCVQCSKLIADVGIAGVWLYHSNGWRRYEAAEFHRLSLKNDRAACQPPRRAPEGRSCMNLAHLRDALELELARPPIIDGNGKEYATIPRDLLRDCAKALEPTPKSLVHMLRAEGYRPRHNADDAAVCAENPCDKCQHPHTRYHGFYKDGSYRAVSVCPNCGDEQEF